MSLLLYVTICVMSPETDIYAYIFSYATYVVPENSEKNKVLSVLFCYGYTNKNYLFLWLV